MPCFISTGHGMLSRISTQSALPLRPNLSELNGSARSTLIPSLISYPGISAFSCSNVPNNVWTLGVNTPSTCLNAHRRGQKVYSFKAEIKTISSSENLIIGSVSTQFHQFHALGKALFMRRNLVVPEGARRSFSQTADFDDGLTIRIRSLGEIKQCVGWGATKHGLPLTVLFATVGWIAHVLEHIETSAGHHTLAG